MAEARLMINGTAPRTVAPGDPVRFGRHHQPGVVGLSEPSDTSLSSDQGEIAWEGNALVLTNRSTKVALWVEYRDLVLHVHVPPGGRHVFSDHAVVIAPGERWISVELPRSSAHPVPGGTDTVLTTYALSAEQREALAALLCGYLRRFPDHDPKPLQPAQAARLLAEPTTEAAIRRRLDRVKAMVETATGDDLAGQRHREMAMHLFAAGAIGPRDIERIGETFTWRGPT